MPLIGTKVISRRILEYEDVQYKTEEFREILEEIYQNNIRFSNIFINLVVSGDQLGRIMEVVQDQADRLKNKNTYMLEELDRQIASSIANLNYYVNSMKKQSIKVKYERAMCIDE